MGCKGVVRVGEPRRKIGKTKKEARSVFVAYSASSRVQKVHVIVSARSETQREFSASADSQLAKVKQKVSGCFRSVELANAYCRISSYLQTMANRGYNPLIAIQIALNGNAPDERKR